jgi:hypothetical protein
MVALSHKNQKFFMFELLKEKKIFRQLLQLRWFFLKDIFRQLLHLFLRWVFLKDILCIAVEFTLDSEIPSLLVVSSHTAF